MEGSLRLENRVKEEEVETGVGDETRLRGEVDLPGAASLKIEI